MSIASVSNNVSFGRALTTKEKKEYEETIKKARKMLGVGTTTATIFDFSFPSAENDTGIGTSFSYNAQELVSMLKSMCGIDSIQLQPQGQISDYDRSPYSGTSFSYGKHIIDLNKLKSNDYHNLLKASDLKDPYMNRVKNHKKVDYKNVFAPDGQDYMLKKAYLRFRNIDKTDPFYKEFLKFKKKNDYWIEKDALFEAAAVANGTADMREWSERDQNVYAKKEGDVERIKELKQVTDNKGINIVDYEEFVQFIADKQQKESKEDFNKKGIDVFGDCLIGFSQKDYWAHKSAFSKNFEFGCDIGEGNYSCWSPAINFDDLKGDAGELLYNKFNTFFKRYDGVRIDAAWQLIHPLICEPWITDGHDTFDENGNKIGNKLDHQPKISRNGKKIVEDIILKAADANGIAHDKIFLELLGGNSYESLDAVKNKGTTLIHISRYGGEEWGRVKYYESKGSNKYMNMKPGEYTIGPGTHDDYSLLEQVENGKERANYLAKDLNLDAEELKNSKEALSKAIFAEMFTTKNQFATLPDIIGSKRRINIPNKIDGNWTYRISPDFEREYFRNLSEGRGLNTPDALSKALKAKNPGKEIPLIEKLEKYADILGQKGPMTTEEANKFVYNA